jgi:fructosamine-3-kinase
MDAAHLTALLGTPVESIQPLGGGDSCRTARVLLAGGRAVFAKTARTTVPSDFFVAESAGLGWLAECGAVPIPAVLAVDASTLVLDWETEAAPSPAAAARFGAALADLHLAGAPAFGAPWAGYIGPLPMPNSPTGGSWAEFYRRRRIEPYVRMLRESGALRDVGPFDRFAARLPELAGPEEPPARLHGDLWSGNLVWAESGVHLVDPAAHGGHRETDLAMLHLFGAPYLERILASYADRAADRGSPLAPGWPDRVPLHQLFPLLVHAVIFGGGYLDRALTVVRQYAG